MACVQIHINTRTHAYIVTHTHMYTQKKNSTLDCTHSLQPLIQGGHLHRAVRGEGEREGVGDEGDINLDE